MRKPWAAGLVVLAACLVGTLVAWHALTLAASRHRDEFDRSVREATKALARLGPATPATDRAAVASLFETAPVEGSVRDDRASINRLRVLAAEFISMRFEQSSSSAYRAWRESHGAVWTPVDLLAESMGLRADYQRRFDRPFPESPAQLFDDYWDAPRRRGEATTHVAGVLTQAGAVQIALRTIKASNPMGPMLEGVLGLETWHGLESVGMIGHWQPPRSREELLREHGWADVALVGVIVETADGTRRPMIMGFLWDPKPSRWFLTHLSFANENGSLCRLSY